VSISPTCFRAASTHEDPKSAQDSQIICVFSCFWNSRVKTAHNTLVKSTLGVTLGKILNGNSVKILKGYLTSSSLLNLIIIFLLHFLYWGRFIKKKFLKLFFSNCQNDHLLQLRNFGAACDSPYPNENYKLFVTGGDGTLLYNFLIHWMQIFTVKLLRCDTLLGGYTKGQVEWSVWMTYIDVQ